MKHVNKAVDSVCKQEYNVLMALGYENLNESMFFRLFRAENLQAKHHPTLDAIKACIINLAKIDRRKRICSLCEAVSLLDEGKDSSAFGYMGWSFRIATMGKNQMACGYNNKDHFKATIFFSCERLDLYSKSFLVRYS